MEDFKPNTHINIYIKQLPYIFSDGLQHKVIVDGWQKSHLGISIIINTLIYIFNTCFDYLPVLAHPYNQGEGGITFITDDICVNALIHVNKIY